MARTNENGHCSHEEIVAILHPCSEPRCPKLLPRGQSRCPEHARKAQQAYDRSRGSAKERGYDAEHRAWRRQVLARDPVCTACGKEPSTYADHIVPLRQGGAKTDLANGAGMCSRCHQAKRGRERHEQMEPYRRPSGRTGGDPIGWA